MSTSTNPFPGFELKFTGSMKDVAEAIVKDLFAKNVGTADAAKNKGHTKATGRSVIHALNKYDVSDDSDSDGDIPSTTVWRNMTGLPPNNDDKQHQLPKTPTATAASRPLPGLESAVKIKLTTPLQRAKLAKYGQDPAASPMERTVAEGSEVAETQGAAATQVVKSKNSAKTGEKDRSWLVSEHDRILDLCAQQVRDGQLSVQWNRIANAYNTAHYRQLQVGGQETVVGTAFRVEAALAEDRAAPWRTRRAIFSQMRSNQKYLDILKQAKAKYAQRRSAEGHINKLPPDDREILEADYDKRSLAASSDDVEKMPAEPQDGFSAQGGLAASSTNPNKEDMSGSKVKKRKTVYETDGSVEDGGISSPELNTDIGDLDQNAHTAHIQYAASHTGYPSKKRRRVKSLGEGAEAGASLHAQDKDSQG